jgi:hypothetical protein
MRVFYKDSILQVFNTNHIVEIYSYSKRLKLSSKEYLDCRPRARFESSTPAVVYGRGIPRITPMRVFYKDSILQVFNTNHIVEIYSYDDGRTWN